MFICSIVNVRKLKGSQCNKNANMHLNPIDKSFFARSKHITKIRQLKLYTYFPCSLFYSNPYRWFIAKVCKCVIWINHGAFWLKKIVWYWSCTSKQRQSMARDICLVTSYTLVGGRFDFKSAVPICVIWITSDIVLWCMAQDPSRDKPKLVPNQCRLRSIMPHGLLGHNTLTYLGLA